MALDGIFLSKLINEMQCIVGTKINKVYQLGNDEFLFNLKGKESAKMLISTNASNYRIHLTNKQYSTPKEPSSFVMFLRKHLEGGVIKSIKQISLDRIILINIIKHNELKDLEEKYIIIELVGKASNLILTDNNFNIIDSLKHVINIEADKLIIPKSLYKINISKDNIFENKALTQDIYSKQELQNKYYGISPMLYDAYVNNDNPNDFLFKLDNIKISPVSFSYNNKDEFYFSNIFDSECIKYDTLSILLDEFYYQRATTSIIKQKTNNIDTVVKRLIERTNKKISNQKDELIEASNNDKYKIYGELITANIYQLPKTASSVSVLNYYTNEFITIELDPLLSVIDNANKYYTKYQKMKKAISHLENQINLSNQELEYLSLISMQISQANLNDIKEIRNELISNRYINDTKVDKRKDKILPLVYVTDEGSEILVGKNNSQNELITHKLAKHNELWFHVKDGPGSHVVLRKTDDFTEMDIRTSAMLAAYYSTYKQSSSVEVVYTLVKYIKKIPGHKNCFVTFSNEKTIFIDPDNNFINNLNIK